MMSFVFVVFSILFMFVFNGSLIGVLVIISCGIIVVLCVIGSIGSLSGGVVFGSGDSFVNFGMIIVSDCNVMFFIIGIVGGVMVINSGLIFLDGGIGIFGGKIVNIGSIVQIDGGVIV